MTRFSLIVFGAALALSAGAAQAQDAAAGEKAFRQCRSCHALDAGKHRVGPTLHQIFGRKAGTAEGFANYSEGLKASGIVWSADKLDVYLTDPKKVIADSRMAFAGIANPEERANLIAYLKQATQ